MKLCSEVTQNILESISVRPVGYAYSEEKVFVNEISMDASIIIPCYNSKAYLKDCLESVVKQETAYSYEIIVVNDGSTDNTLDIISEFANKYSHIVVIDQANKGFSGARNSGIRVARGKYLLFVDSDDYVKGSYVNNLVDSAIKADADISACGYFTFKDSKIIKDIKANGNNDSKLLNGCFWAKAFKRELFNNIIFPEGYWYEDSILAHLIYPRMNSYVTVEGCQYAYRSNEAGITISSRGKKKSIDTFYVTDLMIESVKSLLGKDYFKSDKYYNLLLEQFYLNQNRIRGLDKEVQKIVFDAQSEFIISEFKHGKCNNWKFKRYAKALENGQFDNSLNELKLDKFYKAIEIIKRKFG